MLANLQLVASKTKAPENSKLPQPQKQVQPANETGE